MANLFDLDDALFEKKEEKKETKKDYDVELKKARAFSIRGLKDKALEIYNSILEEDFENEGALVGILRVHSDNFRVFEGKEIEDDIFAIESMCPEIMDDEYLSYISSRDAALKQKKEAKKEEPKKAEKPVEEQPKKEEKPVVVETFDDLFNKARKMPSDKRLEAIDIYLKAINKATDNDQKKKAYYEIGQLYYDEAYDNDPSYFYNAIDSYEDCIKCCSSQDDYYYISHFHIGDIHQMSYEYDEAIEYFLIARKGFALANYYLALAYYEIGEKLECDVYLSAYINSDDPDKVFLNDALYKFGMMHYEGDGIKQNLNVAKRSFERLRDLGDSRGNEMLKKL